MRKTIDSEATALECSHGLAHSIMHDRFKFWKVCIWWVARELKDQEKMNWMGLSLQHLLQYEDEGEECLIWLLLGTNHGCITTNLNQSGLHCNGNIPVNLQPKFWGYAISWESYAYCVLGFSGSTAFFVSPSSELKCKCEFWIVLLKVQDGIHRKRPGQLARRLLLHHENARPHTPRATQARIQELEWELLEHPPYSPN
jgi:histone-lysine N-methyltransferase SETMAR